MPIREMLPYAAAIAGAAVPIIAVNLGKPSLREYVSRSLQGSIMIVAKAELVAASAIGAYAFHQAANSLLR